MKTTWINLNHPCRKIDLCEAESDEEQRILWGQGYVPLMRLQESARHIWYDLEPVMRVYDATKGEKT